MTFPELSANFSIIFLFLWLKKIWC